MKQLKKRKKPDRQTEMWGCVGGGNSWKYRILHKYGAPKQRQWRRWEWRGGRGCWGSTSINEIEEVRKFHLRLAWDPTANNSRMSKQMMEQASTRSLSFPSQRERLERVIPFLNVGFSLSGNIFQLQLTFSLALSLSLYCSLLHFLSCTLAAHTLTIWWWEIVRPRQHVWVFHRRRTLEDFSRPLRAHCVVWVAPDRTTLSDSSIRFDSTEQSDRAKHRLNAKDIYSKDTAHTHTPASPFALYIGAKKTSVCVSVSVFVSVFSCVFVRRVACLCIWKMGTVKNY